MRWIKTFEGHGSESITPAQALSMINKLHSSGWEGKRFEDPEWVLSHQRFDLEEVELGDPRFKWAYGQHPPVSAEYSKREGDFPPIFIASNGFIIDGTHRCGAARKRGDSTIMAYVGR
jgi:hypothetical protein